MKVKYDTYLAISMHGRLGQDVIDQGDLAIKWCEKLGLTYYAPWKDEKIDPKKIIDLRPSRAVMRGYVRKDYHFLDRCRSLTNLTADKSSSGTGWEMGRAFYHLKRPIIAVAPRMADRQLTNFTTIHATKICATQGQAFHWLARRLKRRTK